MSNDRQYVVSESVDSTARAWNVSTARQVGNALCGHEEWVKVKNEEGG